MRRSLKLLGLFSLLEIVTTTRVVCRSLGGLKMFGEKNLVKFTMCTDIEVIPRLLCPVFHFHQF